MRGDPGLGISRIDKPAVTRLLDEVAGLFSEVEDAAGQILANSPELFQLVAASQQIIGGSNSLRTAIDGLSDRFSTVSNPREQLAYGFGILAAVWPFHTWSPVGHVAAPTPVSMVHAGVLMKIGAFGVLRVGIFLCPEGWQYWAPLMAVLAAIGIVYGAFVGLSQTDLKYCIGYSSVSHMGIVGLGLATVSVDGLNGAVFQMFAHGIMTALFFSAIGYIYDRTHTKMISELGGLSRIMPVASTYFIVAALAGIGVPCLASFWGELVVFIAAFKTYPLWGTLAVCALVVSALFMLRVVQRTFYGPKNEKFEHIPDVSFGLGLPRMILMAVLVIFGLFPSLMYDMIETASIPFMNGLP